MPPEVREHLFEPFFTTKGPGKGTGLGLAMVYGIIKQSGGHIDVVSAVGQGASFRIYLPLLKDPARAAGSEPGLYRIPGGSETVLLVEDEDGVRALARLILQASGYTVLEAANGREALRLVNQHTGPLHLLVADVVMPQMSGRQLADILLARRPEMKVLYISGYTDDAVVRHGVSGTTMPFLHKPFTPASLSRKVREILGS
jgi:two-component system cell cycle sensor histidine kinase/response regulator CckA